MPAITGSTKREMETRQGGERKTHGHNVHAKNFKQSLPIPMAS